MKRRHHPGLAWPQVKEGPLNVACAFCDTLQRAPRLPSGDSAYCCCCGALLYKNRPNSLAHATSFSMASLIFMVIAHSYPCITMKSGAMSTQLTLWESVRVFADMEEPLLAFAVAFFTIFSPLIISFSLLYVAAPLRYGIALPGAETCTRFFQRFQPWSMLEVFLLGLLVSLLKLKSLAELHFDIGLAALVGVVLCSSAAAAGIDRLELWDRLEVARHAKD